MWLYLLVVNFTSLYSDVNSVSSLDLIKTSENNFYKNVCNFYTIYHIALSQFVSKQPKKYDIFLFI